MSELDDIAHFLVRLASYLSDVEVGPKTATISAEAWMIS